MKSKLLIDDIMTSLWSLMTAPNLYSHFIIWELQTRSPLVVYCVNSLRTGCSLCSTLCPQWFVVPGAQRYWWNGWSAPGFMVAPQSNLFFSFRYGGGGRVVGGWWPSGNQSGGAMRIQAICPKSRIAISPEGLMLCFCQRTNVHPVCSG